jgi:hypothetical protein
MLAKRTEAAREAAEEAGRLSERLRYPVGKAASLEAAGAVDEDHEAGAKALAEAKEAWLELGRPLDAARSEYIRGLCLQHVDPDAAAESLERAAAEAEAHGVDHLAKLARSAVPG